MACSDVSFPRMGDFAGVLPPLPFLGKFGSVMGDLLIFLVTESEQVDLVTKSEQARKNSLSTSAILHGGS